jgi:hypothetical protein
MVDQGVRRFDAFRPRQGNIRQPRAHLHPRFPAPDQKAQAAAKYAIEREKEALERQKRGTSGSFGPEVGEYGRSAEKAAEKFGVSKNTVKRAVKVEKHGAEELKEAVANAR